MSEVQACRGVESGSGDVLLWYGIVVGFVKFVIAWDKHFGALECLVDNAHLHTYAEFALEHAFAKSELCGSINRAIQTHRLLREVHTHSPTLVEELKWHIAECVERHWRIVDAEPLHAAAGFDADIVGGAYGGRVVVILNSPILRELRIGLRLGCYRGDCCKDACDDVMRVLILLAFFLRFLFFFLFSFGSVIFSFNSISLTFGL